MRMLPNRRRMVAGIVSAISTLIYRRSAAEIPGRVVAIDRPGFYRIGPEGPEPISRAAVLGTDGQPEPARVERIEVPGASIPLVIVRHWPGDPRSSCVLCPWRCAAFVGRSGGWECITPG